MVSTRETPLPSGGARPHTGHMTTTQTLPEPDLQENQASYKTKRVAFRKAAEFASLNGAGDREVDEVFEASLWNGGYFVPVWLQYIVTATDEGWTITSNRWYSNPKNQ